MKSIALLLAATALVFAGSASGVSNLFSLGAANAAGAISRAPVQQGIMWGFFPGGIRIRCTGTRIGVCQIIDMRGRTIRSLVLDNMQSAVWDGRDAGNAPVPCCMVLIKVGNTVKIASYQPGAQR